MKTASTSSTESRRESVIKLVAQIQQADYEGDRSMLNRLYEGLMPFVEDEIFASKVLYWRGFAMWRRAINGFNDLVDPKELGEDLIRGANEFDAAITKDAEFVDAKIGAAACRGLSAYLLHRENTVRAQELALWAQTLLNEVENAAPNNPRLLWALGPLRWNTPPERGGGPEKTIELYERGLKIIKEMKSKSVDPLEPSWGEPELLMSLAWSNLNRTAPNLDAAEINARASLAIIPYWHYVRDILLPQIMAAKDQHG